MMKYTRFHNPRALLLASSLSILASVSSVTALKAASFLEGTTITISSHLNDNPPQSVVVPPNLAPGQAEILSSPFNWMISGDRFDFVYDVDRERLRFFVNGEHTFSAGDVLYISYELEEGLAFGTSALTHTYTGPDAVKGFVEGRVLRFELRALDLISADEDGDPGPGAQIEFTTFVQERSVNESPQITCAEPLVIDCTPAEGASVTPEVTVTDSDDHQTLTVILKSGNTELDRQFVLAPANNAVVKFKPVLLAPGSHPLTVSVFDGFEQASCESSVTINADDSAPTFTTVPEDIVVTATSLNGAFVNFSDAIASDNCSVPTVVYSHNPETQFPIGTTTVICTATDLVGNESTESFTVTVGLPWSGVLQPINEDGSSVFKAGSTVPVKFRLTGVAAGVSDLHATLSFAKVSNLSVGTVNEAVSTANATSGNLFRFDPAAQQYIFNWSTKGLTAGTYQLLIDLGDGVEHTVIVGLR